MSDICPDFSLPTKNSTTFERAQGIRFFCVPFLTFLGSFRSRIGSILERNESKNNKIGPILERNESKSDIKGTQKSGSLSGIGEQKLKFGLKPNGYVSGIGEPSLFS